MHLSGGRLPKRGGLAGLGLFSTYANTPEGYAQWIASMPPEVRAAREAWRQAKVTLGLTSPPSMRTEFTREFLDSYVQDQGSFGATVRRNSILRQGGYDVLFARIAKYEQDYSSWWEQERNFAVSVGGLGQGGDMIATIVAIAIAGAAAGGSSSGGAAATEGGATTATTTATTTVPTTTTTTVTAQQAAQAASVAVPVAAGGSGSSSASEPSPAPSPPQSIPSTGLLNYLDKIPKEYQDIAKTGYGIYAASQNGQNIAPPSAEITSQPAPPAEGFQGMLKKWGIPAAFTAFLLLR